MKRFLVLCLALMLSGCVKQEKTVKRAVFAWNGVETEDRVILDKYQIDTIFMDINHYSSISNYNIFVLAGDPSWGVDDMQKVVDEAEEKRADGVIFDIEGDYSLLASNLSLLDSHLPIYVCIPFWLDEDVWDGVIKEADGIVVMNYSKEFEEGSDEWKGQLEYDMRSSKLKNTLRNLKLILDNDQTLANIVYNEQSDGLEKKGTVPWSSPSKYWRDADDAQLLMYLSDNYGEFSRSVYEVVVAKVADDRRYHPIKEYLSGLPEWDGIKRLDTLLVDYFGAVDNAYTRAVTRKTLCAAVQRVYHPGIKFDNMLVLNGGQGIGKSTLIKKLAGEWFSDSLILSDGKVNGQTGKGVFTIVEVKDGWGRLKSGAGWIWLENPSYCTVNKTTSSTKTVDELAREVLNGAWGNGEDRKQRLTAAGYDYSAVQAKVNELMGAATPTKSIDELAREVIAGKWGNGAERKNRLTAAGYDYSVVQNRVNQILKK